jgi:hypothetical protein
MMMRCSNAINDNVVEHIRVARLTQDREVRRRPPTPQLKKGFQKGAQGGAGRRQGRQREGGRHVRRGEPNARNEIRGSFARSSRCRGYITRVLTRVMTPIYQDASVMAECDGRVLSGENECAARAWPELRTNVVARIF